MNFIIGAALYFVLWLNLALPEIWKKWQEFFISMVTISRALVYQTYSFLVILDKYLQDEVYSYHPCLSVSLSVCQSLNISETAECFFPEVFMKFGSIK